MTYERLKEVSKEYSRRGFFNIVNNLTDEDLLETYKVLKEELLKESIGDDEMLDIFMLQDDINCIIVSRWEIGRAHV